MDNNFRTFQINQAGLPIGKIFNVSGTNYLALLAKRPVGRIGVNYDAEVSENLDSWTLPGLDPPINNGDATETLTFRDLVPANDAPHRFIRLKLTSF